MRGVSGEMTTPSIGQQPPMVQQSSPVEAWQYNTILPNQTPMEIDTKNYSRVAYSPECNGSEYMGFSSMTTKPTVSEIEEENSSQPAQMTMDKLRGFQMTLEKNKYMPTMLTPKPSECPVEEDKVKKEQYDEDMEKYDQELRTPEMNSHGKIKTYKCKYCPFIATNKINYWKHSKLHMKEDKILTCPRCPFVTVFKHHLAYHMRNHDGSKPYKCSKCDYSCLNNSMLNSHKKSHSNIYQYRCADCRYATKYCHSLKLHLRKHKHSPAMVLNADGTPNPLQVIDVYGTTRRHILKPQIRIPNEATTSNPEPVIPIPFDPFMLYAATPTVRSKLQDPRVLENWKRLVQGSQEAASVPSTSQATPLFASLAHQLNQNGVLDLSMPERFHNDQRIGFPSKVESPSNNEYARDEKDDDERYTTMFDNVEVFHDRDLEDHSNTEVTDNGNQNSCQYCNLTFGDAITYTIHMGYHGLDNPFTCNICGEECADKLSFNLHNARRYHIEFP